MTRWIASVDYDKRSRERWDLYFYKICCAVASKSPCLSRQIGAILVRDNSVVSTGYNGPPRGVSHCGSARLKTDQALIHEIAARGLEWKEEYNSMCPRKILDFKSGEGLEWCPAQHAEENAVSNAARLGVSVNGTTLYLNTQPPCQRCLGTLINAGIVEIVALTLNHYDPLVGLLMSNTEILLRTFSFQEKECH